MTQPTPTGADAMKEAERLVEILFWRSQHAGIAATLDKPAVEHLRDHQAEEARDALLAFISKLVEAQPAAVAGEAPAWVCAKQHPHLAEVSIFLTSNEGTAKEYEAIGWTVLPFTNGSIQP